MSLAPLVRAMGRGPARGRSLTRAEAAQAMRLMLSGEAAPEAVGAILMLMRYRGETPEEIAGFVDALREGLASWQEIGAAVDWPSYAAGRSRGLPWFLLSARLVAQAGLPVLLHGWNSHQRSGADVRGMLGAAGIATETAPAEAAAAIARCGVVYVPLEAMDRSALALLRLRDVLGLRSPVNTALRALNPAGAATSVQGVFHPPYRLLQQDAARLLGQPRLMVLKGGGGEFERHAAKPIALFGLCDGEPFEAEAPALLSDTRRLADEDPDPGFLPALWRGERQDRFAEAVVTGTAAIALHAAGAAPSLAAAELLSRELWQNRNRALAA